MLKKLLYFIWLVIFCTVAFVTLKIANISDFIDVIESRTFDLRQNVLINNHAKAHNDNIVIVAIDDASYEYILDNYGEWPLTRDVYAKLVDYLEAQHPQSVAFDLMFVKSMKSLPQADLALVNSFKKYDNLYTAMNFDNQPEDLRIPPTLPKKLAVNLKNNGGKVDFTAQTYTNCRSILPAILDATSNVGMINVSRAEDGILRRMPVFLSYQGKFYPQLGLKVGLNYLKNRDNMVDNNFVIDGNYLKLGNRKIYLDDNANAILNWYGSAGTYEYIPL